MTYAEVIESVASRPAGRVSGHPVRVAVDGRTACGKSAFARALCASLEGRGRTVLHTTIDGFQKSESRALRARAVVDGRLSARRARSGSGPAGIARSARTGRRQDDLHRDVRPRCGRAPVASPGARWAGDHPPGGWHRPRPARSRPCRDLHVFLVTSREAVRTRGVQRDAVSSGDRALAEALYAQRYLPAFDVYTAETDPEAHADILIDLEDLASPRVRRMGTS